MQEWLIPVLSALGAAIIFGIIGFLLGIRHRKRTAEALLGSAEEESKRILSEAIKNAEAKKKEAILEAKDEIHQLRNESEKELKDRRREVQLSLIHILLETPTSGEIWFEGQMINKKDANVDELRRKMGMVFQHFNLFPHLTVMQNITLAPVTLKLQSKEEASENALKSVSYTHLDVYKRQTLYVPEGSWP